MTPVSNYLLDDGGASAAEYALILSFVAIGIIGGLNLLGGAINNVLTDSSNHIGATTSS